MHSESGDYWGRTLTLHIEKYFGTIPSASVPDPYTKKVLYNLIYVGATYIDGKIHTCDEECLIHPKKTE